MALDTFGLDDRAGDSLVEDFAGGLPGSARWRSGEIRQVSGRRRHQANHIDGVGGLDAELPLALAVAEGAFR